MEPIWQWISAKGGGPVAGKLDVLIQAAGGVVWRERKQLEVLVIHRPAYDDWTFPKGKRSRADAHLADTALREVREETGLHCALGDELLTIEYVDRKGRFKHASYWTMEPLAGKFSTNREVDIVRWVAVARVHEVLTYDRDRQVLAAFARWCADGRLPAAVSG